MLSIKKSNICMISSCLYLLLDFGWLLTKYDLSLPITRYWYLQKYHNTCFSRSGVNHMWILKHSKDLLETLSSRSQYVCNSIKTLDHLYDLVFLIFIARFWMAFDKVWFVSTNNKILIHLFSVLLWEVTLNQFLWCSVTEPFSFRWLSTSHLSKWACS
jgi:hypothetical protein